jgi:hypothetical protein
VYEVQIGEDVAGYYRDQMLSTRDTISRCAFSDFVVAVLIRCVREMAQTYFDLVAVNSSLIANFSAMTSPSNVHTVNLRPPLYNVRPLLLLCGIIAVGCAGSLRYRFAHREPVPVRVCVRCVMYVMRLNVLVCTPVCFFVCAAPCTAAVAQRDAAPIGRAH